MITFFDRDKNMFVFIMIAILVCRVTAQLPNYPPSYQMNKSTIIMPCNYTGFTDPATIKGWAIIDFDWSNARAIWATGHPMDCAERLVEQVEMLVASSPETRVWVYRNSIKALPWYTSVREKLQDPAYAAWHMKFKPQGPYYVSPCDNNYNPPLCSDYYHDQTQTPEFPSGLHGTCASPACDVGSVPVGEYLWDPRAWNISINNQTLGEWFINDYLFDPTGGGNANVSGFFFDDVWGKSYSFCTLLNLEKEKYVHKRRCVSFPSSWHCASFPSPSPKPQRRWCRRQRPLPR